MNRILQFVTVFTIITAIKSSPASAQSWLWARQPALTAYNQEVLGTAVNNNGDVFVCGYYQTSLNIGTATTLGTNFPGDYLDFIAKYDAAGNPVWLKNITGQGPTSCSAMDVSADTLGNCYVTYGYGYASASPGSLFNYASSYGGFHDVKKLDASGNQVWHFAPAFGSSSGCVMESIKTDGAGNSYITGYISGTVTFGSVTLTAGSSGSVFVLKLEPTGAVYYAVQGIGQSLAHSIDIDENGYAVIGGYFNNSLTLGNTTVTSNGQRDLFYARLDPNGNFIWAKSAGSSATNEEIWGVAIDNPRIYFTGIFGDNFNFGPIAVTTHGARDILVAGTDTAGNALWALSNGGGSADDIGYDIATDRNGGVYVTGNYNGPATFGSTNLTGANGTFLVKYDIIGIQQWVKKAVGVSISATGKTIASNLNTDVMMGGSLCCYGSTLDFSGSNITLNPNGVAGNYGKGMYVAKVGYCSLTAAASADQSINCSDTITLSASGGSFFSWSPSTGLSSTTGAAVQAHPVNTTTYIVTVSDSAGCSNIDSVTVTVTGGPTIMVTGDTTLCMGQSTQLFAQGAGTWNWSPATGVSNTTVSNPVFNPADTTVYTVTGTDVYGCTGTQTVTIIVHALPATPLISVNVAVLTSTPAAGYQWNLNGGPIAGANNQTYTVPVNGIYTVTVTDINGCQATSSPLLFNTVGIAEPKDWIAVPLPGILPEEVTLELAANINSSGARFVVTDVSGRRISDRFFNGSTITLHHNDFRSGLYFYTVELPGLGSFTGRFMVQ
ncbi:MAG TPA: SBBP repeat-containing protein [Bacteroidia bacterium]|nr:SBBP repeat-containing protein [Bacteroidia bacterium]